MFAKASLSSGISVGPEPRGWEPRVANAGRDAGWLIKILPKKHVYNNN